MKIELLEFSMTHSSALLIAVLFASLVSSGISQTLEGMRTFSLHHFTFIGERYKIVCDKHCSGNKDWLPDYVKSAADLDDNAIEELVLYHTKKQIDALM